jgi:hypothetical protein
MVQVVSLGGSGLVPSTEPQAAHTASTRALALQREAAWRGRRRVIARPVVIAVAIKAGQIIAFI